MSETLQNIMNRLIKDAIPDRFSRGDLELGKYFVEQSDNKYYDVGIVIDHVPFEDALLLVADSMDYYREGKSSMIRVLAQLELSYPNLSKITGHNLRFTSEEVARDCCWKLRASLKKERLPANKVVITLDKEYLLCDDPFLIEDKENIHIHYWYLDL